MPLRRPAFFSCLLIAAAPFFARAAGTDEMWEITTKMEMAGMPMAMPATTSQVCLPKNRSSDEGLVPKDKNSDCKMDSVQTSGAKTTFKMTCSGQHPMTGDGEMEKGVDSYRGKMHIAGNMEGQAVDMTQTYSGRKVGSCAYEDPGRKAQAQQQAMTAEMCRKAIDDLQWLVFKDDTRQYPMCKPFKKDFCARVTTVANEMRDPAAFRATVKKQNDWQSLLGTCGIDTQPLLADACRKGVDASDYQFVAAYCPAQAKALAAEHCAGRDYTTMMTGPLAPICSDIARQRSQAEVMPGKQDLIKGGVTEGVNKLKKMLPF